MHEMMADLYLETFLIVDDRRLDKWYLRFYDTEHNRVTWTQDKKKAKEFDTKDEAYQFGKQLKRQFFVEEQEAWIW